MVLQLVCFTCSDFQNSFFKLPVKTVKFVSKIIEYTVYCGIVMVIPAVGRCTLCMLHIVSSIFVITCVFSTGWSHLITKWITAHSIDVWRDMQTAVNALANDTKYCHDDLQ